MNARALTMTLSLVLSSCVVGTDAQNCNELSCDGCCDSDGNCKKGTENSDCGGNGGACQSCNGVNICLFISATSGKCTTCGDNRCDPNETCSSCPGDCGSCCGNGTCNSTETCSTCPQDCGSCCGNGTCNTNETCSSCSTDCGVCTSGNPYDRCSFNSQCKSAAPTCYSTATTRCRRTGCTSDASCPTVSGYTAFCSSNTSVCFLRCTSATAICPYSGVCRRFSDNTYGYCD